MGKAFIIASADLARCPTHDLSVAHWNSDGTCQHERPLKAVRAAEARVARAEVTLYAAQRLLAETRATLAAAAAVAQQKRRP